MKIAFVIPFAFERFFHDCKEIHTNPEEFEDNYISKRVTWHFNWCLSMMNAGMEVTLYHLSKYGKSTRYYNHCSGVPIIRVPISWVGIGGHDEISFYLLKEIKKQNPDTIFSVTHVLWSMFDMYDLLSLFARIKKIPIATRNAHSDTYRLIFRRTSQIIFQNRKLKTFHTLNSLLKRFYNVSKLFRYYWMEQLKFIIKKNSLRNSNMIFIQTELDFFNLHKIFYVNPQRIKIIPKPIDINFFSKMNKDIAAQKVGLSLKNMYLLHVSNLVNSKGCDNIIRVMPNIIKKYPNLILLVTGNGQERKKLENLTKSMGLDSYVKFLGHVEKEKLVFYYNLSESMVLPTDLIIEGQPNAILEAIACNTIPIATNYPGPASVISNGLGVLIEPDNQVDLENSILSVLGGKISIDSIARDKFLIDYSFENIGRILKQIFMDLITIKKQAKK